MFFEIKQMFFDTYGFTIWCESFYLLTHIFGQFVAVFLKVIILQLKYSCQK
jgi:hypothetical protein